MHHWGSIWLQVVSMAQQLQRDISTSNHKFAPRLYLFSTLSKILQLFGCIGAPIFADPSWQGERWLGSQLCWEHVGAQNRSFSGKLQSVGSCPSVRAREDDGSRPCCVSVHWVGGALQVHGSPDRSSLSGPQASRPPAASVWRSAPASMSGFRFWTRLAIGKVNRATSVKALCSLLIAQKS